MYNDVVPGAWSPLLLVTIVVSLARGQIGSGVVFGFMLVLAGLIVAVTVETAVMTGGVKVIVMVFVPAPGTVYGDDESQNHYEHGVRFLQQWLLRQLLSELKG